MILVVLHKYLKVLLVWSMLFSVSCVANEERQLPIPREYLGMTIDELQRIGTFKLLDPKSDLIDERVQDRVVKYPDGSFFFVFLKSGLVEELLVTDSKFITDCGVKVGDSRTKLKTYCPDLQKLDGNDGLSRQSEALIDRNRGWIFVLEKQNDSREDNDIVIAIKLRQP